MLLMSVVLTCPEICGVNTAYSMYTLQESNIHKIESQYFQITCTNITDRGVFVDAPC